MFDLTIFTDAKMKILLSIIIISLVWNSNDMGRVARIGVPVTYRNLCVCVSRVNETNGLMCSTATAERERERKKSVRHERK